MACLASWLGRSTRILFSRRRNMAQSSSLKSHQKQELVGAVNSHLKQQLYFRNSVFQDTVLPFLLLLYICAWADRTTASCLGERIDLEKKRKNITKIPHIKEVILGDLILGKKNPANNNLTYEHSLYGHNMNYSVWSCQWVIIIPNNNLSALGSILILPQLSYILERMTISIALGNSKSEWPFHSVQCKQGPWRQSGLLFPKHCQARFMLFLHLQAIPLSFVKFPNKQKSKKKKVNIDLHINIHPDSN